MSVRNTMTDIEDGVLTEERRRFTEVHAGAQHAEELARVDTVIGTRGELAVESPNGQLPLPLSQSPTMRPPAP